MVFFFLQYKPNACGQYLHHQFDSSSLFFPFRYRGFILFLTFLFYTAYHLSRKPISIVKVIKPKRLVFFSLESIKIGKNHSLESKSFLKNYEFWKTFRTDPPLLPQTYQSLCRLKDPLIKSKAVLSKSSRLFLSVFMSGPQSELHRNCSTVIRPPDLNVTNNETWCDWEPFGKSQ